MEAQQFVLYVEGTTDDTNGDLRQGFSSLLSKKLQGKMPRIRMANSKSEAISKFKRPLAGDNPLLVIDLDGALITTNKILIEQGLSNESSKVFFMVQEMEGWFFSQPDILDSFYNHNLSAKIKRDPMSIEDPSDKLYQLTKNIPNSKKEPYHKVRHGVPLLKMLDLDKLMLDFDDVKRMVETLRK